MMITLRKLKHIYKERQLTKLKQSRPKINQLFRRMSVFFLPSRKKGVKRGRTKQQRILLRQKRLATTINNKAHQTFSNHTFVQETKEDKEDLP